MYFIHLFNYKSKVVKIILLFALLKFPTCFGTIYNDLPYVEEFHPRDIYEMVRDQPEGLWVVQFYNNSDLNVESHVSNFTIAAKSMMGYVKSASVNIQEHVFTNLVMKITKVPTYFFYGFYKHFPEKVKHMTTVDDIHDESSKQLVQFFEERSVYRYVSLKYNMEMGTKDLREKVTNSLYAWAIVFYKREHPKCKEFAETWEYLVEKFHEKIHFGSVNNPLYKIEDINEEEYPMIKFYRRGKKSGKGPDIYTGELTKEKLVAYLESKISAPKVRQITHANVVASCLKRKFCIFSFLPKITECNDQCRLDFMEILDGTCEQNKLRSWVWFWNEYDEQPDIETALGVNSDDGINGTIIVVNVQAAVVMKIPLKETLTHDVLNRIVTDIREDNGFFFEISAKEVPDIKYVKKWPLVKHEEL